MLSIKADLNPGLDTWDWGRIRSKTDEANAVIDNGGPVGHPDKESDGAQVTSRKKPKVPYSEYTMQPDREKSTLTVCKRGAQASQRYLDRGIGDGYKPECKREEDW